MRQQMREWTRLGWMWTAALLLMPGIASALPVVYSLTSGSATLRATIAGSATSPFEGATSVAFDLDHGTITWDAMTQEVSNLAFGASGPILIDLDQALVPLDSITLQQIGWASPTGLTATANAFGQFNLPTVLSAEVSGVLPDQSLFGPELVVGEGGQAAGRIVANADSTLVRLTGVDLAVFDQLDPSGPGIVVKADFTFIAERVGVQPIPEPSAALLFGLGTVVVGSLQARRRSRTQEA
jgi:hypothetical protein